MFEFDHAVFTFAQDGAAPTPGTPVQGTPGDAAANGGTTPARPGGIFDMNFMLIMLLMIVGVIVLSSWGQRREKRRRDQLLGNIHKHDRVQTSGGVIGSVVEIKPDTIVLKVDESSNTRITFARSAVQHILSSRGDKSAEDSAADASSSEKD